MEDVITAQWQHELQVYNGSLFPKCHRPDTKHLKCMQLTTMTSSLLCPKLKSSWYSGHYTIIRKFSANVGQVSHPVHTGFVSQLKCPELRKHDMHKRRQPVNVSNLCSRKRHYLYYPVSKQICPLPQRESLSLPSKAVCQTNILENIVQNRSCQCVCSEDMQKCKTSVKKCLHKISL